MSELQQKIWFVLREAQRYLQVARLTPPLPLLLILGPALGALVLASNGLSGTGKLVGLLVTTLSLWGFAWGFNDLMNALREDVNHSHILRGVVTKKQAISLLAALMVIALSVALLLGWRFMTLALLPQVLACTFPWLRRHTYLIEAWLGLGIAWSVPLAYAAAGVWPDKVGALLGVVALLWAMGWMVLKQWPQHAELMERGYRSLGLMFGASTGYLVIALQASVLLGAWMVGTQAKLGTLYAISLLIAAVAIVWQSLLLHRHGSAATQTASTLHLIGGAILWLGVLLHFATT